MQVARFAGVVGVLGIAWVFQDKAKPALPPEPVVTHSASSAKPGQRIEHGELILDVDEAHRKLNAQHHSYKVLETRQVPGSFTKPAMKDVKDFALSKSDLDVINPGPGEYVHGAGWSPAVPG